MSALQNKKDKHTSKQMQTPIQSDGNNSASEQSCQQILYTSGTAGAHFFAFRSDHLFAVF